MCWTLELIIGASSRSSEDGVPLHPTLSLPLSWAHDLEAGQASFLLCDLGSTINGVFGKKKKSFNMLYTLNLHNVIGQRYSIHFKKCIYLFLAVLGLHCHSGLALVAASRAALQLCYAGFSSWWLLLLWRTDSRVHGLQ